MSNMITLVAARGQLVSLVLAMVTVMRSGPRPENRRISPREAANLKAMELQIAEELLVERTGRSGVTLGRVPEREARQRRAARGGLHCTNLADLLHGQEALSGAHWLSELQIAPGPGRDHSAPGLKDMIQICLAERTWREEPEWPATLPFCIDPSRILPSEASRQRAARGAKKEDQAAGRGWRRWPRSAPARLFLRSKRQSFRAGIVIRECFEENIKPLALATGMRSAYEPQGRGAAACQGAPGLRSSGPDSRTHRGHDLKPPSCEYLARSWLEAFFLNE